VSVRQILPVIGAAIGGYFGGPTGAQWGWAIGSALGNAVDPELIRGPSVGDIATQTSQEGVPRPIVFGLSQPMAGNIIASSEPRIVRRRERQGKGGPKVETESVYRTYAIGVCEGPIGGFVRVWRNGALVYDAGSAAMNEGHDLTFLGQHITTITENGKFQANARFFLGQYDQKPSPDLETIFGVGTTPAHRGTAYMVMADEDLTDLRGAIPQWMFQVQLCSSETVLLLTANSGDLFERVSPATSVVVEHAGVGSHTGIDEDIFKFPTASYHIENQFIDHTNWVDVYDESAPDRFTFPGPFTFEGWFRRVTDGGGALQTLMANNKVITLPTSWVIGVSANIFGNTLQWLATESAGGGVFTDLPMPYNEWQHVAITRDEDGIVRGFMHGVCSAITFLHENTVGGPSTDGFSHFTVGEGIPFLSADFDGYFDQIRAVHACLYTDDFTPPGGPFSLGLEGDECTQLLPDIVTAIADRAGLPSSLIDVSDLADIPCHGLTVINLYPAFAALKSLSEIFLFDCAGMDGKVHFVLRGHDTVATITEAEMLLDDEPNIEQARRSDPIQIPRVLHLNYFDVAGGLSTEKQSSERSGDRRATGETSLQSAVVMTSTEAARAVAINHKIMIEAQRGEIKFSLPDSWIRLVPSAPVFVQWQGSTLRALIIKGDTNDGYQEYALLHDRQSAYVSNVEPFPISPPSDPPSSVVGPTVIVPLDIHILRDADDAQGLIYYVAVSGLLGAWQGALVELSFDSGATYVDAGSTDVSAVIGELLSPLADHPQSFPDAVNSCSVRIHTPFAELEQATLTDLLNRANLAIIGDEIIQFGNADETSDGEWQLSYFLRGRKGTSTQSHATGTRFVLLDPNTLARIDASLVDIGRTMTFRATSFGTAPEDGIVVSMAYTGRAQIEREPGYVRARRDGTDAIVDWQGVGRIGAGATVVQGERFDGYRVTFDDGTNPVITVNTDAQTVTQSIAALGSPVTISVLQLNELTGEGPAIEVIIT
jgi:putative tail protein/concanavalin A-like lectin/glucanase superfamily protein